MSARALLACALAIAAVGLDSPQAPPAPPAKKEPTVTKKENQPPTITQRSEGPNSPNIVGDNNQIFYGPTTVFVGPPPRLLNKAQAESAVRILTPFAGTEAVLAFVASASTDEDIGLVGRQLQSVFQVSGWKVSGASYGDMNILNGLNPAYGIHIATKDFESDLGRAVVAALSNTPVGTGTKLNTSLVDMLVRGPMSRRRRPGGSEQGLPDLPPFPPVAIMIGHRR